MSDEIKVLTYDELCRDINLKAIEIRENHRELDSLQSQLRIARETLEGIRDHPHRDDGDACNEQNSSYTAAEFTQKHWHRLGIMFGHRCASKLAADGLEKMGGKE